MPVDTFHIVWICRTDHFRIRTNITFGLIPFIQFFLLSLLHVLSTGSKILLPLDDNDNDDDDNVNVISRHCTKSPTILPLTAADAIEEETYLIGNNITNGICNAINRPFISVK